MCEGRASTLATVQVPVVHVICSRLKEVPGVLLVGGFGAVGERDEVGVVAPHDERGDASARTVRVNAVVSVAGVAGVFVPVRRMAVGVAGGGARLADPDLTPCLVAAPPAVEGSQ